MARKKKKRKPAAGNAPRSAPESPFNPVVPADRKGRGQAPMGAVKADAPVAPSERARDRQFDEERVFLQAMAGVKPIAKGNRIVTPQPDPQRRPPHPVRDEELEVMAALSDLVSGTAELDITFSDEYIEGCVRGFSRKLMLRLKRGEFPVQDHIDLHGLTQTDAETKLRDFLVNCHQLGIRCVLVVHGRGLNSENNIPVLKERLPVWLNRAPVKRFVLAFSTARPYDGGTGAIYILLRKWKGC